MAKKQTHCLHLHTGHSQQAVLLHLPVSSSTSLHGAQTAAFHFSTTYVLLSSHTTTSPTYSLLTIPWGLGVVLHFEEYLDLPPTQAAWLASTYPFYSFHNLISINILRTKFLLFHYISFHCLSLVFRDSTFALFLKKKI